LSYLKVSQRNPRNGGEGEVVALELEDRSSDKKNYLMRETTIQINRTTNIRQSSHEMRQQKQTTEILS
jgi:hypothetical protein